MMKKFFSVPFKTKEDHHVNLAVLACVDPRFRLSDQQAIEQGLGIKNFDFYRWPGVTKPLLSSEEFFELFCVAIQNVSIKLHQVEKLLLLCHWDCGGYGGSCSFGSCEQEEKKYQDDLSEARKKLQENFPGLEIMIGYSKDVNGTLEYYLI